MNPLLVLLGEVTLVFGVAFLGARLATRARAAVRHLILASAFGVVLVLPLATLVSPTITVEIAALPERAPEPLATDLRVPAIVAPEETAPLHVEASPFSTTPPSHVPEKPVPVTTWLILTWAMIGIVALMPVIAGLWHLRGIRRRSRPWPEGAARLDQLMRPDASRLPMVLLHEGMAAPITGGLIHPAIALPAEAVTWSDTHLTNALLHELEHVWRRDWAVHLATRGVCALYWFHPLSWIAWRALRLEAEQACDDAVLARGDGAVYAEQLLELARRLSGKPALPGLHMVGNSSLSSRIRAVLDNSRPRGRAGQMALIGVALVSILAIALLAPLRPTGPTRRAALNPEPDPVTATAEVAAPLLQPEKSSTRAFNYDNGIGLVDLRDGGCLSIFNPSIEAGTKVTLVKPRSSDPPAIVEATVEATQKQECKSRLDRHDSSNIVPSYYRLAMPANDKPYGIAFAILEPRGPVALRDGQIAADIEGDGALESFETCNSTENLHYMVWSGPATQRRQRWHGNIYVGYDMEPTCTDGNISSMEPQAVTTQGPRSTPSTGRSRKITSPREVVSEILELIQSALADEVTGKLDDIERPITGLHHVQRHARAVLNDDGSSPATLAAHYVEIINALATTANSAVTVAGRRPDLQLSPEKFQQLAAAMRAKSAELAATVMPVSDIQPNISTPTHRAALNALELAQAARSEPRFSPSWLPTHLNTLARAAQSVASDDGETPGATTMKVSLLRSALGVATRQANEIAGRANVRDEARRKAADLAKSLSGIVDQLDGRTLSAGLTMGIEWLVTVRSVGPLAIGTSISDVRSIIGDPAAYLIQALHQGHALPREPENSSCAYLMSTRVPEHLGLMFQNGRLARIDVYKPGTRTTGGAQIGDSEARILDLYGSRISVKQHHYPPAGAHYMTFTPADNADRDYRMLFETDGVKVTQFRVGLRAAVEQVEGCE